MSASAPHPVAPEAIDLWKGGSASDAVEHSVYAPRPEHAPPVPDRKRMDVFRDYLPGADDET